MKKFLLGLIGLFLVHKLLLWTQPFGPLLSEVPFSTEIVDSKGQLLRLAIAGDEIYRLYTPLEEISPLAVKSTLLFEDRYFNYHFGVNPISLVKAFWTTYVKKSRRVGASTITMQFVRSRYKINTRGISGKLHQILRAFQVEFLYSKNEILQAYFNIAPYGFNIEGIGAASRIYFNKPSRRLSLVEALTLSVIPQSPYQRTRHVRERGTVNKALKEARSLLFGQWMESYPENAEKKYDFNLELEMRHPHNLPFLAPHIVTEVLSSGRTGRVELTLDLGIQQTFEEVAKTYLQQRKNLGINNYAALLVDTRDMSSQAYIGSADFFSNEIFGQVNGVKARRSPGSTLKPFAYGLAIEEGKIHPLTMLKDAPTPFGTYTPDNFDREFAGPLSATDALVHSRNIPAIHLESILEKQSLYQFLSNRGIPLNPDPEHYGLSIVLGTAEVTMIELVSLYSMLNNEGRFRPIRFTKNEPSSTGEKAWSSEANFLVLEMLNQNPKPEVGSQDKWRLQPQSVSWKTGTSVGFRDAWSVGVFGHYALAVWVGNFSGKGNPEFVGRAAAGPLLFSFIEALAKIKGLQFEKPYPNAKLNISEVEVCALSGHLPHKDCPHRRRGWFIPGVSPIQSCQVHRRVDIDRISGLQVCPGFKGQTDSKVFEYWSTDLLKLFKMAGLGRKQPPSLHPNCLGEAHGDIAPKILSPKEDIVYNLRTKGSDSKRVPLLAVADGPIKKLTWYIDNELVGKSQVNAPLLWTAKAGHHRARVVDDQGRSSEIQFVVQWID